MSFKSFPAGNKISLTTAQKKVMNYILRHQEKVAFSALEKIKYPKSIVDKKFKMKYQRPILRDRKNTMR